MAEYIAKDKLWGTFVNEPFYDNADKDEIVLPIIDSFPAADVAPVLHARWEQDADGDWYCTHCDARTCICDSGKERTYRKPYCPNCGAKMDGGVDDEID